jgi:phosphohistidine phosphatase
LKTLTLLRHAKSGWDDPVTRDFDRPLNAKGKRAAETVGRNMRSLDLAFDHVVASPAVRVGETLDAVVAGYGRTLAPVWERRIYLASAAGSSCTTSSKVAAAEHVLLVGHNPGLEDLVLMLVPAAPDGLRALVEEKYPTATLAEMRFDIADWSAVAAGGGDLRRFVRPRDLDPSLGPDER